jgi:hypothetical protein
MLNPAGTGFGPHEPAIMALLCRSSQYSRAADAAALGSQ